MGGRAFVDQHKCVQYSMLGRQIPPLSLFADVYVVYRPSRASTSISWMLVWLAKSSRRNSALGRNWPSTFVKQANSFLKVKRRATHSFPDS
jgi:hypothetical protein